MFHRPSLLVAAIALSGLVLAPLPVGATELPPDLVRLSNGGLLRGTIIEAVPGEKVVILLPSGETRTLAGDEFDYAGPAGEAPARPEAPIASTDPTPKPHITVRAPEARLALRTPSEAVTWYVSRRIGGLLVHDRLCTSPCEIELPVGVYDLALALPERSPLPAEGSINITGSGTLDGVYEEHPTRQLVGGSLFLAGLLGGLALSLVPLATLDEDDDYVPYVTAGVSVFVVGTVAGLIISKPNKAHITFQPE